MNNTITKHEAAREAVKEAQQAHGNQAEVVQQFREVLNRERQECTEAQQRMDAGTGTADDVTTVALGQGKINAVQDALTKAEARHAELGTGVAQAKVLEFVERVREAHPDGVNAEIQQAKDNAAEEIAKILDKTKDKITALHGEARLIADELGALAKPLIWEHGDSRSGFYVDETPACREVGITLGSRRSGTKPSLTTEDGYRLSAEHSAPFRELEELGKDLGEKANSISRNR